MGGFLARNRVAVRLALRDARANRGRTTFVAILVALPVLAVTTLLVLQTSERPSGPDLARSSLGLAAQAQVTGWFERPLTQSPDATSLYAVSPAQDGPLEEHEAALRAALPARDTLLPVAAGWVSVSAPAHPAPTRIDGAALPASVAGGLPYRDGRAPAGPGEVALDSSWLATLGTGLGRTLTVTTPSGDETDLEVVAVLSATWLGPSLVVSPDALGTTAWTTTRDTGAATPQWWVIGPDPVTWEHVEAVNALGSIVLSGAVLTDPPPEGAPAGPPPGLRALRPYVAYAIGFSAVLLELILVIGPAFGVGVRRTERHLALLAAVGGDRSTLGRVVRYGAAGIGLGASTAGVVVGVGLAAATRAAVHRWIDPYIYPTFRVPVLAILGVAAAGTAVAVAAAWLPARRATAIDVVAALAGRGARARRRRVGGTVALAVTGVGVLLASWAVLAVSTLLLLAGLIVLVFGLVGLAGPMVGATARLAPRLGPAGRFAARDGDRERSRTAPAVAAVTAATATMVAAVVMSHVMAEDDARGYAAVVGPDVVTVDLTDDDRSPEARAADARDLTETLRKHLPVDDVRPVSVAVVPTSRDARWQYAVTAVPPTENLCPLELAAAEGTAPPDGWTVNDDVRCTTSTTRGMWGLAWGGSDLSTAGALVDDGTAVSLTGLPGSQAAAAALRVGHAVVRSPLELWPDGTAHVALTRESLRGRQTVAEVVVPAVAVPLGGATPLVLPPAALDGLGIDQRVAGLIATTTHPPAAAELDATARALGTHGTVTLEAGPPRTALGMTFLVLVGLAVLVGLGATAVVLALAAADSRRDLEVLAAVGAAPRMRRRIAAAQAAVVTVLGSTVGSVAGVALGAAALAVAQRTWRGWEVLGPWPVVVVIALGLPLLATGGAYLLTPSRLPAVARRIA